MPNGLNLRNLIRETIPRVNLKGLSKQQLERPEKRSTLPLRLLGIGKTPEQIRMRTGRPIQITPSTYPTESVLSGLTRLQPAAQTVTRGMAAVGRPILETIQALPTQLRHPAKTAEQTARVLFPKFFTPRAKRALAERDFDEYLETVGILSMGPLRPVSERAQEVKQRAIVREKAKLELKGLPKLTTLALERGFVQDPQILTESAQKFGVPLTRLVELGAEAPFALPKSSQEALLMVQGVDLLRFPILGKSPEESFSLSQRKRLAEIGITPREALALKATSEEKIRRTVMGLRLKPGEPTVITKESVLTKLRHGIPTSELHPKELALIEKPLRHPLVMEAEKIAAKGEITAAKMARLKEIEAQLPPNQKAQVRVLLETLKPAQPTRPTPAISFQRGDLFLGQGRSYQVTDVYSNGYVRAVDNLGNPRVFPPQVPEGLKRALQPEQLGEASPGKVYQSLKEHRGFINLNAEIELTQGETQSRVSGPGQAVLEKIDRGFEAGREMKKPVQISRALRLKTELLDRLAPIADFVEKTQKTVPEPTQKPLPGFEKYVSEVNPYQRLQLLNGLQGKIQQRFNQAITPILLKNRDRLNDLDKLMLLQREEEILGRITIHGRLHPEIAVGQQVIPGTIGRNIRRAGFETTFSDDEIKIAYSALKEKYGPEGFKELRQAAFAINQQMISFLEEYKNSGMINQSQFNAITASNQRYVPFEIVDYLNSKLAEGTFAHRTYNVGQESVLKELRGTPRLKASPLEAIPSKIARMVSIGEKNKALRSFVDLRFQAPFMKDLIPVYERGPIPKDMGKISVFLDGTKTDFLVPVEVANALKQTDAQTANILTELLSPGAELLRKTATGYNMGFMVANLPRDYQDALLGQYTEEGFSGMVNLALNLPKGLASAIRQDQLYQQWLASGGSHSSLSRQFFRDPEIGIRELVGVERKNIGQRVIEKALHGVEEAIRISEETTRLAKFQTDLEMGKSLAQAGYGSRTITLDFAAGGNAVKQLNRVVPYLNASFLATGRLLDLAKKDLPRLTLGGTALFGTLGALTYLHNRQFKDWEDVKGWERDFNWIFITRDRTPEERSREEPIRMYKWPKGWISQILGNSVQHFLEFVEGSGEEGKRSITEFAMDTIENYSPVGLPGIGRERTLRSAAITLPPPIRAVLGPVANIRFFTGQPVVPLSLSDVAPEEQFKPYTSPTFVALAQSNLGRRLGLSPLVLEAALRESTGSLSEMVMDVIDAGVLFLTDVENIPGLKTSSQRSGAYQSLVENPVTRRFVGSFGGATEQTQFKRVAELEKETATERIKNRRIAEKIYQEIKEAPFEQKFGILRSYIEKGQFSQKVRDRIVEVHDQETRGITALDRRLLLMSVDQRAQFIYEQLFSLGGEQEKLLYLMELRSKDVLTDKTIDELVKIAGEQDQGLGTIPSLP